MRLRTHDGEIRAFVVRDSKRNTLLPKAFEHVAPVSTVDTYSFGSYHDLRRAYVYHVINHAVRYVDGRVHLRISDESFLEVPRRLRVALGKLIRVDSDDIILGNSASYGLAMLAAAMAWQCLRRQCPGVRATRCCSSAANFPQPSFPGASPSDKRESAFLQGRRRLFAGS